MPTAAHSETPFDPAAARCALRDVIAAKSLITGRDMKLVSGGTSRFYFHMKMTTLDPAGAGLVGRLMLEALDEPWPDHIAGVELGAVPVVAAAVVRSADIGRPITGFAVRKAAKEHGAMRRIERDLAPGSRVALFEDVTTTGGSALRAVEAIREAGGVVTQVVTVVDRLQGAREAFARAGMPFGALLDARDFDLAPGG